MHWLLLVLAIGLVPAAYPSQSPANSDFLGGLVGGIIGGAIGSGANQQQPQQRTTQTWTVRPNPQRQANREMQTALNYFSFPAGTPDGAVGPATRSAITAYQTYMKFPPTGNITQFERDILVAAMNVGQAGIPETVQLVATSPEGARALLTRQLELMTGTTTARRGYPGVPIEVSTAIDEIAETSDPTAEQLLQRSGFIQLADLNGDGNNDYIIDTSFSGSSFWCSATQCKTIVFVSVPDGYARNDLLAFNPTAATFQCFGATCQVNAAPTTKLAVQPTVPQQNQLQMGENGTIMVSNSGHPSLPTFGAAAKVGADPSLSSFCSKVSF
ncbi:MAG: peptidoglycan-binding domain-containing protein [Aestuariivita sp.]|nr:peptidoglycan-binding domain-containing protein [Aestuariivita sp.]MCY4201356.1 peptidoglycan-binding domain-containing protein [Aestuariivita sp.]